MVSNVCMQMLRGSFGFVYVFVYFLFFLFFFGHRERIIILGFFFLFFYYFAETLTFYIAFSPPLRVDRNYLRNKQEVK